MKINIKYFGRIVEHTHKKEETLELEDAFVRDLKRKLLEKYPTLNEISFQIAQGHNMVKESTPLSKEEVALLPPFAGG